MIQTIRADLSELHNATGFANFAAIRRKLTAFRDPWLLPLDGKEGLVGKMWIF